MKQEINSRIILFAVVAGMILSILSLGFATETLAYPQVIEPLPKDEWTSLNDEFHALNNYSLYSGLDKFGLIDLRPYNVPESAISGSNITDKDAAIEAAKDILIKNSRFSGVEDKSQLALERAIEVNNGKTMNIDFGNQIYDGIEVDSTQIRVNVNAKGAYVIQGHWYSNIELSWAEQAVFDEDEAKEKLIGKDIMYGNEKVADAYSYRISEKDLKGEAEKVILPIKSEDNIKLHLAWKIPVDMNDAVAAWYFYIDAVTGDELKMREMFATSGAGGNSGSMPETRAQAAPGDKFAYLYYAIPAAIIIIVIIILVLMKRKKPSQGH